jgi:hypothetical protein
MSKKISAKSVNRQASRQLAVEKGLSDKEDQEAEDVSEPEFDVKAIKHMSAKARQVANLVASMKLTKEYETASDVAKIALGRAYEIKAKLELETSHKIEDVKRAVAALQKQAASVGINVLALAPTQNKMRRDMKNSAVSALLAEVWKTTRDVPLWKSARHVGENLVKGVVCTRRREFAETANFSIKRPKTFSLSLFLASCGLTFVRSLPTWFRISCGVAAFVLSPVPRMAWKMYKSYRSLYRPSVREGSPSNVDDCIPVDEKSEPMRLIPLTYGVCRDIAFAHNKNPTFSQEPSFKNTWDQYLALIGSKKTTVRVEFTHAGNLDMSVKDIRLVSCRDVKLTDVTPRVAAFIETDLTTGQRSHHLCSLDSVDSCIIKYAGLPPQSVLEACRRHMTYNNCQNIPAEFSYNVVEGSIRLAQLRIERLQQIRSLNEAGGNNLADRMYTYLDWVCSPGCVSAAVNATERICSVIASANSSVLATAKKAKISNSLGMPCMISRPLKFAWQRLWGVTSQD